MSGVLIQVMARSRSFGRPHLQLHDPATPQTPKLPPNTASHHTIPTDDVARPPAMVINYSKWVSALRSHPRLFPN